MKVITMIWRTIKLLIGKGTVKAIEGAIKVLEMVTA